MTIARSPNGNDMLKFLAMCVDQPTKSFDEESPPRLRSNPYEERSIRFVVYYRRYTNPAWFFNSSHTTLMDATDILRRLSSMTDVLNEKQIVEVKVMQEVMGWQRG